MSGFCFEEEERKKKKKRVWSLSFLPLSRVVSFIVFLEEKNKCAT